MKFKLSAFILLAAYFVSAVIIRCSDNFGYGNSPFSLDVTTAVGNVTAHDITVGDLTAATGTFSGNLGVSGTSGLATTTIDNGYLYVTQTQPAIVAAFAQRDDTSTVNAVVIQNEGEGIALYINNQDGHGDDESLVVANADTDSTEDVVQLSGWGNGTIINIYNKDADFLAETIVARDKWNRPTFVVLHSGDIYSSGSAFITGGFSYSTGSVGGLFEAESIEVGGGYGGSGSTLSDAGAGSFDADLISDTDIYAGGDILTGGDIWASGTGYFEDQIIVGGATSPTNLFYVSQDSAGTQTPVATIVNNSTSQTIALKVSNEDNLNTTSALNVYSKRGQALLVESETQTSIALAEFRAYSAAGILFEVRGGSQSFGMTYNNAPTSGYLSDGQAVRYEMFKGDMDNGVNTTIGETKVIMVDNAAGNNSTAFLWRLKDGAALEDVAKIISGATDAVIFYYDVVTPADMWASGTINAGTGSFNDIEVVSTAEFATHSLKIGSYQAVVWDNTTETGRMAWGNDPFVNASTGSVIFGNPFAWIDSVVPGQSIPTGVQNLSISNVTTTGFDWAIESPATGTIYWFAGGRD